ncbi:MAG: carbon-nitrogen hydrolase family protein [Polyangiaceae bacterium]|nr:carbon-nitrogen hydrolase family protein [Polyangiaceae bacterium]
MPAVSLAACQVHVTLDDYASEESFNRMLDRVGAKLSAHRAASPARECLAVFPEMIGSFLPVAGRARLARYARTVDGAMALIGARSLPRVLSAMIRGRTGSPKVGLLLAAAPDVRRIYRDAFRRFAREQGAWVVAGSALLPRNAHGDLSDRFEPQDGRIYNTSYAFDPEGRHVGCVRKVNLVPTLEDELGLSPGRPDELFAMETSFGRVGTLICYDGFCIAHTRGEPGFQRLAARYDEQGAVVLAQPAANPWPWDEPWVFAEPGETQLRREQWHSEGLFAQLAGGKYKHNEYKNIQYAVVPQLLGGVMDTRFDGRSHLLAREPDGARVIAEAAHAEARPHAEEVVLRTVEVGTS